MKKIIYSILIAFAISAALTSCTEEEVAPTPVELNGGGSAVSDKGA
jgi:hypothetical protein